MKAICEISNDPLNGFDPKLDVVVCYCFVGERFLLLDRVGTRTWCLPGGKVDQGESLFAGMKRELWEETGIEVLESALRGLGKVHGRSGNCDYFLHFFEMKLDHHPKVILSPDEHCAYRWVNYGEAHQLPLIIGDKVLPFYEECIK